MNVIKRSGEEVVFNADKIEVNFWLSILSVFFYFTLGVDT